MSRECFIWGWAHQYEEATGLLTIDLFTLKKELWTSIR